MLNIISRSILFKGVSGPKKVVENLIKGLDKLGYPYVFNKRLDACKKLYIHDDRCALKQIKKLSRDIKVIAGPNLYVLPREIPKNIDLSRIIYLQPSQWVKDFWLDFRFNKCLVDVWPTGIDTDSFNPLDDKKEFVLIYFKQRFGDELKQVEDVLRKKKLDYRIIKYGNYKEIDYKNLLSKSRYIIWLGRQESQGLALQEALALNIPILVCDVHSVGYCDSGGEFNEEEKDYKNTTSAPYFSDACGLKIKDFLELNNAVDFMEQNIQKFQPREYILKNLNLEKQAKDLILLYEKHFELFYKDGFKEKLLKEGDWINNKLYYIFYLKLKHFIKMFFVKIGIWNYVWKLLNK